MKNKIIKLMAYIFMPLIFTFLGYFIAYVALAPALDMLQAAGSMVMAKEAPDFNTGLNSIYKKTNNKTTDSSKKRNIDEISINDIEFPDDETQYARIKCNRIKLDAPVYWGDSNAVLKAGVGNYIGSFIPGFGKSILLSGHNTTYFKPLKNIAVNDIITYDTNYGEYQYKVKKLEVLNEDVAAKTCNDLLSQNTETLIMYTCYPFKKLSYRKTDRFFVFADKISGPTVIE